MRILKIPSNPAELLGKMWTVVKYFLFSSGIAVKIGMHKAVLKTLSPFRERKLVAFRATLMYILPYLSRSFNIPQKQSILIDHYTFLHDNFPSLLISELFGSGLELYNDSDNNDQYSIVLKPVTTHLEFEGSMSILFNLNDATIYSLNFTFLKGEVFDLNDQYIIYISALQGVKNTIEQIKISTKYFKENSMPVILLKALEVIAIAFDVSQCIGVSANNQLSLKSSTQSEQFFNTYDLFWMNHGGKHFKNDYLLKLPLIPKPILEIPQTHRNRKLKKRQKLNDITAEIFKTICLIMHKDQYSRNKVEKAFVIGN